MTFSSLEQSICVSIRVSKEASMPFGSSRRRRDADTELNALFQPRKVASLVSAAHRWSREAEASGAAPQQVAVVGVRMNWIPWSSD